jgi:hypothetical protein
MDGGVFVLLLMSFDKLNLNLRDMFNDNDTEFDSPADDDFQDKEESQVASGSNGFAPKATRKQAAILRKVADLETFGLQELMKRCGLSYGNALYFLGRMAKANLIKKLDINKYCLYSKVPAPAGPNIANAAAEEEHLPESRGGARLSAPRPNPRFRTRTLPIGSRKPAFGRLSIGNWPWLLPAAGKLVP